MWGDGKSSNGEHGQCMSAPLAGMLDAEDDLGFWNYFQYGLDFLISSSGYVTKIILHSNIARLPLDSIM
jgi:hypothetical protein